jgi:hypothetical protein
MRRRGNPVPERRASTDGSTDERSVPKRSREIQQSRTGTPFAAVADTVVHPQQARMDARTNETTFQTWTQQLGIDRQDRAGVTAESTCSATAQLCRPGLSSSGGRSAGGGQEQHGKRAPRIAAWWRQRAVAERAVAERAVPERAVPEKVTGNWQRSGANRSDQRRVRRWRPRRS